MVMQCPYCLNISVLVVYQGTSRRDGRVDEGAGLENQYTGNRIVGSNPTPSASLVIFSIYKEKVIAQDKRLVIILE